MKSRVALVLTFATLIYTCKRPQFYLKKKIAETIQEIITNLLQLLDFQILICYNYLAARFGP